MMKQRSLKGKFLLVKSFCVLLGLFTVLFSQSANAARHPHLQPVGVECEAMEVQAPGPGTYYLEMDAAVPPNLGTRAIRYSVWIGDRQVIEQMGRGSWNTNYVPYWTIERRGSGKGLLQYAMPLKVEKGSRVLVFVPKKGGQAFTNNARPTVVPKWEGKVSEVRLRPALKGLSASFTSGLAHKVHFAGSSPQANVRIKGPAGKKLKGKLVLQHLRLADSLGGNNWNADTRLTEVKRIREIPVDAELSAKGVAQLKVAVPDKLNRTVGITLILEEGKKLWVKYLGSLVIVPKRDMESYNEDGRFLSSFHLQIRKGKYFALHSKLAGDVVVNALKRMGIDWVRHACFWGTWEPKPDKVDWSEADMLYDAFRENRICVMHAVGPVPQWARGAGWNNGLDTKGLKKSNFKGRTIYTDYSPRKEMLPGFGKAHRKFYERYKDVIRASNVWNEPWEGMGITGWKSTGEHYRNIIREIKDAVNAADPSIRVIAADSPHNTNWKLFAAGMEDVIDAISTHYTPPSVGYSFSLANVYDKEVWETESWLAWKGDAASVRHALYYFAVGGDKVSLYNQQMFFDHHQNPTPTVTWTATMREMLEDLKFEKVVHPGRPPYVLLFVGENRHVAAVTSSLSTGKIPENANFRSQFIGEECTMRIEGGGDYTLYDMLGNPIEKKSGEELAVTVSPEPRYIEFRGDAEEFEERLANAEYEGLRPVEIFIHDITGRLSNGPSLPVELHNAYGVPISGKIRVRAKGLQLPEKSRKFQLKAAGSNTVNFSVTGKTTDANQFPVVVEVETDRGSARAEDKVHVSVVAEGSPTVDGNISEWKRFGAIPVVMSGTSTASLQQQAWFPWKKLAESEGKFTAQFAFASDAQNLYMMARVKDTSQNILPSLLNGKNLHNLQNPPYDYTYVHAGPTPGAGGDHIQLALAGADDRPFKPKYELYPPGHPLYRFGAFLNSEYLYMIYPTEGGDAEIMRMRTPDFYYLHPLPIDYEWMGKHCRVAGARVSVRRLEAGYVYEVAIPWEELSALSHGPGDRLRMNVAVQNKGRGNRLT